MINFVNTGQDKATASYFQKSTSDTTYKEATLKISGDKRHLDSIEAMLAYMEYLGNIGHSTSFKVMVDGDGAFNIKTTDTYGESLAKKYRDEITSPNGKDIESFSFD